MGRLSNAGVEPKKFQSGLLNKGWYHGQVIEEYETTGTFAKVHKTTDYVSGNGDSRNLKLCVRVVSGSQAKDFTYTINYNPSALFDDERVAEVASALKAVNNDTMKLADRAMMRDALSIQRLSEVEDAFGITLQKSDEGGVNTDDLVGKQADIYLSIHRMKGADERNSEAVPKDVLAEALTSGDTKGMFNKITALAAIGTKVKTKETVTA